MDTDLVDNTLKLTVSRGYTVNGVYVNIGSFDVNIDSTDLATLMSTAPASTTIYGSIRQTLYQYLLDKNFVSGTII